MADLMIVDLDAMPLIWPLGDDALEDLRWYLEDYLTAPFGVYEDRGGRVEARLADWGRAVYGAVFGSETVQGDVQLVLRSASPTLLALPWELMIAPGCTVPLALGLAGVSRGLPMADDAEAVPVPGGQLRMLMVISRPAGTGDVGYRMIARPLLERLKAVRGAADLVVLRPPTLDALRAELEAAAAAGKPYQVVHFDGHGAVIGGEGVLVFEGASGGEHYVPAAAIASALGHAGVPVVVLNACQSGAVGKELEAAVATALLREGVASVVAMAYTVYAVAAAEFMAAFYERLFAGGTVGSAVTAGRQQLYRTPGRPSPKGVLPLADWLVPVHYFRREVSFPQAVVPRPVKLPSLVGLTGTAGEVGTGDLVAVDGVFVGRDALFYNLEAAARLQKVVVLAGLGGTGKTELAKAFGRWWCDTGGVGRPDWVFWHSFEPGVASFSLDGVITEIGLTLFGSQFELLGKEPRRTLVQKALIEHRMLLLWDNLESVREMPDPGRATPPLDDAGCEEIRGFLAHLAACGKSAVVITSRTREDWLGPIHRIEVGGFTRTEAVEYADVLLATYPTAQQQRERRSFGELLEWLDGHPLAMRLTLPRLEATEPGDLLAGLRDTTLLSRDVAGPGPERLSSLEACVTYSFAHLTAQARRLLPALSLLHGIADTGLLATFSAVETVPARFAGISRQEWAVVLRDAARVGLLVGLDAALYRIHPALPGYLAGGWHAENPGGYIQERQASEQALCIACVHFTHWVDRQVASGNAALTNTLVGLHWRTLGAMLGHALDHRAWDEAHSIVDTMGAYWSSRSLDREAAAWTDRILAAAVGPIQPSDLAARSLQLHAITGQARRELVAGQLEQAAQDYRQVLALLREQPETERASSIANVYHELGIIAFRRGRLDEAEEWCRKSLAIEEELGNRSGMASSYHQFSIIVFQQRRLDEAEEWCRKSLAIEEELGNRSGMAESYHQLGITFFHRGRLDEAEQWFLKAFAFQQELGNRLHSASACHQLGITAQGRGRLDEAEQWFLKALTIKEELGNRPALALTYAQLGLLAEARGQASLALEWNIRCVTMFREFPSPLTGRAPSILTRLARQLGMPVLESAWHQATGHSLPQQVREYITSHHDDDGNQP